MRALRRRERGVVLVSFFFIFSAFIVAGSLGWLTLVMRQSLSAQEEQRAVYLKEMERRIELYTQLNANMLGGATAVSPEAVMKSLNMPEKWGVTVAVSNLLVKDGVPYRAIAAYLPTDTDDVNPADIDGFASTGLFKACLYADKPCGTRLWVSRNSYAEQLSKMERTLSNLQIVANRLQLYAKQRILIDPERNPAVNYFLPRSKDCNPATSLSPETELPCVTSYTPMTSGSAAEIATRLGLQPDQVVDAWGQPIELWSVTTTSWVYGAPAPGAGEPRYAAAPFTLMLRANTPMGERRVVVTQPVE